MFYKQIYPIEPLQKYVRYFWVLEGNSQDFSEKIFKIMSDGMPGLIFQTNKKAFRDKNNQELPQLFVYGQTTRYTEQRAINSFQNIGIYFQPSALKSIFRIDANELTNQHIDIDDLLKTTITEQISNTASTDEKIALLSTFLLRQLQRTNINSQKPDFAIAQLEKGMSLQDVQNELKMSERSLERYFKQYIGISPKLFSRIGRFQSALEIIRHPPFEKLTDIAYQSDYFDQSHFIRDFKEFAGTSPKKFKLHANEIVSNFPEWKV